MKLRYKKSFLKDIKKIHDAEIKNEVLKLLESISSVSGPKEIQALKKISGYKDYFRIKVKSYRLGIRITGDEIIFVRLLHRKDVYRYFPAK